MESTSSSQFRSSHSPVLLSCDLTSPNYTQYYNRVNKSCTSYTTIFPDCSQLSFEDSASVTEDSDCSSVFDPDDLATKVEILEIKLVLMQQDHDREKVEMLRLHQAMVGMVTDLVKLVSPTNSPLLSPELHLSGKVEPPHLPTKEAAAKQDDSHPRQSDDTVRKQQQQHINKLVPYID